MELFVHRFLKEKKSGFNLNWIKDKNIMNLPETDPRLKYWTSTASSISETFKMHTYMLASEYSRK